MFILSAFVSEYKDRVLPFIKKYWYIFILLLLFQKYVYCWDFKIFTYYLLETVLFIGLLGFSYAVPSINIKTDMSYAMYIYHMTVINAMIVMGYMSTPIYLSIALFISIILSYISTITIGKWSAKIKSRG